MQQEVRLCIVCDSALGAAMFVGLAMQIIQPTVLRLQEKYPGCKLSVGMVTYTTSTIRPAIIARRAFCNPTTLFPLFRAAPHQLGIGTTGLGGPSGMAMLEGLVAAVEMCDDILESPARNLRTRHPNVAQHPARLPPVFYILLIGNSKVDQARRPLYNRSGTLDDVTWESLPEELSKRNIHLSLCISTPKDAKDQPVLALHNKLWPEPDPVWFHKPKGYIVILSGTHMPGAPTANPSKRPPEQPASTGTPKRVKHDSPKPASRPVPGRIDIPPPSFPTAQVLPQAQPQPQAPAQPTPTPVPAPAPAPDPAPAPPVTAPPPAPSIPAPPPPMIPTASSQPHTSPPPPTNPTIPASAQQNPPHPGQPNVPLPGQANPQVLHLYRQIHMALRTPNTPQESRNKLTASGFRIDASGQLIGGAGIVFDARGEPGIGATMPPRMHAMAFERARLMATQGAGVAGANPAALAQRAMAIQAMKQQELLQQRAAQGQAQAQAGPSQPQVQVQPGQLQPTQPAQNSPPKSNASPSLVNRSPSHTHSQPHPIQGALPPQPPQPIAGTPKRSDMGTPQHIGMTPQAQSIGTPQHIATPHSQPAQTPQTYAAPTPQAHLANTPQGPVAPTPQQVVSTPQQPQSHGTPQHIAGTPQLSHATPQTSATQQSPQSTNMGSQQNPNIGGQADLKPNPNPTISQNQNVSSVPGIPPNPSAPAPNPVTTQTWKGQIVYLLRQRDDQAPARLHFHAIAAGAPNNAIETNKWPSRLTATSGFKALSRPAALQLYSTPWPFGQIIIDPAHTATDQQKHAVFHKVITAGYSIFYEFPQDPMNPLPANAPPGSARGLLFFSTPGAQARILFKVFLNHLCPAALCRGGQSAGPGLMGNNANPAATPSTANGGAGAAAVPGAGAGLPAGLPGAAAGITPMPPATAATLPGSGVGLPGAGLVGMPNGASSIMGIQPSNPVPGTGLHGVIPGSGTIPGAGGRPNPAPTPPNINANGNPNPAMGINPAMIPGLNASGIPGLGSGALSGLGNGSIPSLGGPGINPGNVPGLSQGNIPGLTPGNFQGLGGGNVPGLGPAGLNMARNPQQNALYQMALARIGFTPAQFASATPQQKQQIMEQIQRLLMQANHQRQQQQRTAAVASGMGLAGMSPRPGLAPGQPGFEQLQAYMRQQHQRQGGQ